MKNTCTIDVLRHGDTPLTGRFCGLSDPALTEKGWADLSRQTSGKQWDRIISSPLQRCRKFAETLSPPAQIDDRFQELDFGVWEGMSTQEVWEQDQKALTAFWEDPTASPPPNGEPWAILCSRTSEAFEALARAAKGERVLLVTHAGVMRSLLVTQLGLSFSSAWKISLPTASMMQLVSTHDPELDECHIQLTKLREAP